MAWVPKGCTQNNNYVQASITRSAAKVKKEKSENYEGPSQRFQHLRSIHYPYSSTMPLTPMPWSSSSSMIGDPQWAYFNPWMHPYAHIDTYSSWDRYGTRAHSPSYSRPSHHTMQLQEDQHLNNHASKTVSIIRNRSRAQGRKKRW